MGKNKFFDKVYEIVKTIPRGKITTYKEIAHKLNTKAYRLVGQALKHNKNPGVVPCHRVVSSNKTIGGFMGKTKGKEIMLKKKLLEKEGIIIKKNKIINFDEVFFKLT